jgi:hypothetical protein
MGFQKTRVEKACQKFKDDQQVLDYLCFSEKYKQFDVAAVDYAFDSYGGDKPDTLSFLDNHQKLCEMGFSSRDVLETLVDCKNNQEMALEYLCK